MTTDERQRLIKHIRRALYLFATLAVLAFVIEFISAWSSNLILSFFGGLLFLALALIGGLFFLYSSLKDAWHSRSIVGRLIILLTVPLLPYVAVVSALQMSSAGEFCGTWTKLMINRSQYEAIITNESQSLHASRQRNDVSISYRVDSGPPVRIAFNPDGIGDNWSGIVYDPTGEVMLAKGFDREGERLRTPFHILKLFGGDLVACRHIWGDYYRCSFT